MILDPFLLMTLLLIAAFGLTALFFSPVVIELKRPRDQGPRRIPKTPMERRIRNIRRKPSIAGLNQIGCPGDSTNPQDALEEAGVKAARVGSDTLRICGDYTFSPHSVVSIDVVVEGVLKISEDCVFHRSVKAKGNVFIGNRVVIEGNLVSEGDLTILDDVVIGGSVHSDGFVAIGENVFVALSIVAVGNVELSENSEVKGNILTRGVIRVLRHPRADLLSPMDDIG